MFVCVCLYLRACACAFVVCVHVCISFCCVCVCMNERERETLIKAKQSSSSPWTPRTITSLVPGEWVAASHPHPRVGSHPPVANLPREPGCGAPWRRRSRGRRGASPAGRAGSFPSAISGSLCWDPAARVEWLNWGWLAINKPGLSGGKWD